MGDVVRLVDCAPGIPIDGHADLMVWARDWLDSFERGEYGKFRSLTLLVETADGRLATITQAVGANDLCRIIGLLTMAATAKAHGDADINDHRVTTDG